MFDRFSHSEKEIFRLFGMEARLARSKVACVALKWRLVTIEESKHYVTNQYHPEHYSIYPKAGKCTLVCNTVDYYYFINNNPNNWFP